MKKDPYLSLIEYCPQWYVAGLSPAAARCITDSNTTNSL